MSGGQNNNPPPTGNGFASSVKPDVFNDQVPSLSVSEETYFRSIMTEDDHQRTYEDQVSESCHRKIWLHFQASASSLTQLYRKELRGGENRDEDSSLWVPFQSAAANLTQLYRESLDGFRSSAQAGRRSGYQRARRELVLWARSKRRCIRRDELLSILANMSVLESNPTSAVHPPHHLLEDERRIGNGIIQSHQPVLSGVEELLQAASVNETTAAVTNNQVNASSGGVLGTGATVLFPGSGTSHHGLKRPFPSPPPPTRQRSPRQPDSADSSNRDVFMDSMPTPKKPRK